MLKKILFVNLAMIFMSVCAQAYTESDIAGIEQRQYGRIYSGESLGERLYRLENDMLGMSQGGDLDKRVENLVKLNENNYVPGDSVYLNQDMNYSGKRESAIKKFFNGINLSFYVKFMLSYIF